MNDLNTVTLSDFVRNAQIKFLQGADSVMQNMRNSGIFRIEDVPQNTGNVREFSEIDLEQYASIKPEGDQHVRARVQQGYSKIARLYRVSKEIGITYEMRTQNKYTDVVARLTNLGALAPNRQELDMSHRITFGTATTYTNQEGTSVDISMGDTLALFSTVHTVRGASTTYRNRLANNPQLSRGSLEAMEKLIVEETINQFGQKKAVPFDILWTTDDPNTVNTAKELLKATAGISAPNAGVPNVYQAKYKHVWLPLVATDASGNVDSTKAKYWGLASSMMSQAFLGVHEAAHLQVPNVGNNGEDFSTQDWKFAVSAGYFVCIVSGIFIKGSTGDGTA